MVWKTILPYTKKLWEKVLNIGAYETASPIQQVRLHTLNSFSVISIIFTILLCSGFGLSGSTSAWQGFFILPVSVLILYLNHLGKWHIATIFSVFGMMVLILTLALLDRRTGTEYLLLAVACSSALLFEKRTMILTAFAFAIACHIAYVWFDATHPFTPDPTIPYAAVENCILYVSVFFVVLEFILFRRLIVTYATKLEESKQKVVITNEELQTQTEQLDWIVRQKSKELQSYIDAINVNVCSVITNLNGEIVRVNEPFLKLAGYTSGELVGNSMSIFNSGHHSKEFFDHMNTSIHVGLTWRGEVRNKAKDQSSFWLDMVIMPLKTDDKTIGYFLALALPITDRKIADEEALRVARVFESIVHETSHNVRGPLARIKGLVSLFEQGHIGEEEIAWILNSISSNADELDEATRSLTDFVNTQFSKRKSSIH